MVEVGARNRYKKEKNVEKTIVSCRQSRCFVVEEGKKLYEIMRTISSLQQDLSNNCMIASKKGRMGVWESNNYQRGQGSK